MRLKKDSAGKAVLESVIIQGETPDAGGERHLKEISSTVPCRPGIIRFIHARSIRSTAMRHARRFLPGKVIR